MVDKERSFTKIDLDDLQILAGLALEDLNDLFSRNPVIKENYGERLLCITLCQGAALHYIDAVTGIKDFDVWSFFSASENLPFPYRRLVKKDFGNPKFGKSLDSPHFIGRRVDLLGRSIQYSLESDPFEAIQNYLTSSKNKTPVLLSKKAVIGVYPNSILGKIIWPIANGG